MILSKKYNRAMDEITVSDELKAKITAAAAQKINEKNSKRITFLNVRIVYAKCLPKHVLKVIRFSNRIVVFAKT